MIYESFGVLASGVLIFLSRTWLLWAVILLVPFFIAMWRRYISMKYIVNTKWALIEIVMPKEIARTPKSMEVVLSALNQMAGTRFLGHFLNNLVKDNILPGEGIWRHV